MSAGGRGGGHLLDPALHRLVEGDVPAGGTAPVSSDPVLHAACPCRPDYHRVEPVDSAVPVAPAAARVAARAAAGMVRNSPAPVHPGRVQAGHGRQDSARCHQSHDSGPGSDSGDDDVRRAARFAGRCVADPVDCRTRRAWSAADRRHAPESGTPCPGSTGMSPDHLARGARNRVEPAGRAAAPHSAPAFRSQAPLAAVPHHQLPLCQLVARSLVRDAGCPLLVDGDGADDSRCVGSLADPVLSSPDCLVLPMCDRDCCLPKRVSPPTRTSAVPPNDAECALASG